MTITVPTHQSLQEQANIALIFLRQAQQHLEKLQQTRRVELGLFLDSRYEDAVKLIDDAIVQVECSRCPHAATSVRDDGPMCDLCAEDYTVCSGCGKDVRAAIAYEDNGKDYHVECAPYDHYDPTEPQR